jgi:hypothetical protein
MNHVIPSILLILWLAACGPTPAATPTIGIPPAITSHPQSTPTSLPPSEPSSPTEDPSTSLARSQYSLAAHYDFDQYILSASETIRYVNLTGETLTELRLVSHAHNYGAGLQLTSLRWENGNEVVSTTLGEGLWLLELPNPLLHGHSATSLEVEYTLTLPNQNSPLGWVGRQTNFVDWYPFIAEYREGEGWVVREPSAVGEYQVYESADFEVLLDFSHAPPALSVAAAAPPLDPGSWHYSLENARRFAWSAGNQYSVLDAQQDGIPVSIYFFEDQRNAAEAALEVAKQALDLYVDLFGPYPYESLAIVEATFADGMESDGLFFLDQFYFRGYSYDRQNYLTALTAHEIAHNWWFGQVGNDQALEPWLDESLATYSELLYYEAAYPALVDWWWDFRIERFSPTGWVDSSIYDHAEFSPYVHAVYMRGAQFLHAVRTAIGDEAFFSFLNAYAQQGNGKQFSQPDFFALLSQYSSVELSPIVAEFFEK